MNTIGVQRASEFFAEQFTHAFAGHCTSQAGQQPSVSHRMVSQLPVLAV
ncbi:Uncharacterised protein [Mycobacterium tuberculosis]|nr:Uncharacterised protein [Mycobacterium tuberculosis]